MEAIFLYPKIKNQLNLNPVSIALSKKQLHGDPISMA